MGILNRYLDPLDWDRLRPWAWVVVAVIFTAGQVEKLVDDEQSWTVVLDWAFLVLAACLLVGALRDAWRDERRYRQGRQPDAAP